VPCCPVCVEFSHGLSFLCGSLAGVQVEIQRGNLSASIESDIGVAQVIREDDEDVRPPFRRE
jgi:hypothetical protein